MPLERIQLANTEAGQQDQANLIIERYVSTDVPLRALLHATRRPLSPLARALLYLEECLRGRQLARDALQAAQAVPIMGAAPELLLLMLSRWAELSCRLGRPSEAEALIQRVKSLLSDDTRPEIRAETMMAESFLADVTGNKTECERIRRDILTLLPPQSPRRKFFAWEYAMFLAQQGRATEVQNEINNFVAQCNERFPIWRVLLVRFVDAVETGRVREAMGFMSQLLTDQQASNHPSRPVFRYYQTLLRRMYAPIPETTRREDKGVPERAPWLQVIDFLLADNTSEALRIARLEASKGQSSIVGSGFDAYNLIRAELASGVWEGAVRLLNMRQTRGNVHYWDDFFLARAELLAGKRDLAIQHLATLLQSVSRYQAQGRLDFEIRLAREISPDKFTTLRREAEQIALRHREKPLQPFRPAIHPIEIEERYGIERLQGISPQVSEVRNQILRFADLDAPVLITGETGTGKELVARALHEVSYRRNRPFVAVNCASITESLLESELFGHEKGAFTGAEKATKGLFEEAGDGTIFLDEIGDITPRLQTSLLRVLETGEIRAVGSTKTRKIACRILAATNADLVRLAEEGRFRKDLLYRLQRLEIHLAPLRERRVDILILARYFLDAGRPPGMHATISEELSQAIRAYDWPGNVRELKNVIERMRLMHSDKLAYGLADLDLKLQTASTTARRALVPANQAAESSSRLLRPEQPVGTAPKSFPVQRDMGAVSIFDESFDPVTRALEESNSHIRRMERLRKLFDRFGKLTRTEIVRILGVSPNTATKYLRALCQEGYIQRVEPSASTRSHYFVRAATTQPQNPKA